MIIPKDGKVVIAVIGAYQTFFFAYISLRKKCRCSELFWSVFYRIRTEYREIRKYLA